MNRQKAFTLIELLVTVAIIGILAALIFSAAGKVRKGADSVKCLSNLRQTGQAALQYFTDHGGDFLPSKYWEVYPSWGPSNPKRGIRDYLGVDSDQLSISGDSEFFRDSLITCPTLRRMHPGVSVALHRNYSFNYYLNKKDPSSAYNSLPSADRPDLATGYRKLGNVEKPSAFWMFTDGVLSGDGAYYGSYITDTTTSSSLPFPHQGQQHFVFLDGHVEGLNREQFSERTQDRFFWGKLE